MGQEAHSCLGTSLSCGLIECVRISCIIHCNTIIPVSNDTIGTMRSGTRSGEYLCKIKGKEKYDNEKVKIVRQYLYLLAELQIENEKIALTKKQEL